MDREELKQILKESLRIDISENVDNFDKVTIDISLLFDGVELCSSYYSYTHKNRR